MNTEYYEVEAEQWHQVSVLLRDVVRNQEALWNLSWRLAKRFGVKLVFAGDGKPHPIQHLPVNIGTHGPYWTKMVYANDVAAARGCPEAVQEEVRALVSQGVRIRNELLGLYPELSKDLLFPLNLRNA